jgi:hypothetical protein
MSNNRLKGLITVKDIMKAAQFPKASKDHLGRLRVAAAVGTGDDRAERVERLVRAGVDALVLDTAHGHSTAVLETVAEIKRQYPTMEVIGERRHCRRRLRPHRRRLSGRHRPCLDLHDTVTPGVGVHSSPPSPIAAKWPRLRYPGHLDGGIKYPVTSPSAGRPTPDDRRAFRRHRRESGRNHSVPGPQL